MLQQQGGHAAAVHLVGDREGDLRRVRPAGRPVAGHADQLIAQEAEQRAVVLPVGPAHPAGLLLARPAAHGKEAEVQVVRGHILVQLPDSLVILGPGGPDGDGRAVGQQGIREAWRGQRSQRGISAFPGPVACTTMMACPLSMRSTGRPALS